MRDIIKASRQRIFDSTFIHFYKRPGAAYSGMNGLWRSGDWHYLNFGVLKPAKYRLADKLDSTLADFAWNWNRGHFVLAMRGLARKFGLDPKVTFNTERLRSN